MRVAALALFGIASVVAELHQVAVKPKDQKCMLSQFQYGASQPKSRLTLCKWYSQNACCVPQQNAEIGEMFDFLLNLGRGCLRTNNEYDQLRLYYCMGCAPQQPQFTRKIQPVADGPADYEVYLCEDFGDRLYPLGADGKRGSDYDKCGMMTDPGCSMDPYMCGDDLTFPGKGLDHSIDNFMATIQPPLFGDSIDEDAGDTLKFIIWPRANGAKAPSPQEMENNVTASAPTWEELKAQGYTCFGSASSHIPGLLSIGAVLVSTLFML